MERQKLENGNFFLFLKTSFTKICIGCDMKVFNLSVIQQYAEFLFFQKEIFTKKLQLFVSKEKFAFKGYYI